MVSTEGSDSCMESLFPTAVPELSLYSVLSVSLKIAEESPLKRSDHFILARNVENFNSYYE